MMMSLVIALRQVVVSQAHQQHSEEPAHEQDPNKQAHDQDLFEDELIALGAEYAGESTGTRSNSVWCCNKNFYVYLYMCIYVYS